MHVRRVTGDHPICKESEEELAHSGLWEAAEGKVHCTRIQMTWVPVLELLLVVQAVPSQAGYLNSLDGLQVPTHKRRFCFIFASSKILLSWVHSSNAYSKASQTSYLRHLGPPPGHIWQCHSWLSHSGKVLLLLACGGTGQGCY